MTTNVPYRCVRSGYCCTVRPCPFGRPAERQRPADVAAGHVRCAELVAEGWIGDPLDGMPTFTCGIYDKIVGQPGAEWAPAFGTGCCSSMNSDRQKIVRLMIAGHEPRKGDA